jgi:hypothetical protein
VEEKLKKRIVTRRTFPKLALGGALFVFAVLAAAFVIARSRPRPAWYVEPALEAPWAELLAKAPAPPPFTRLRPYDPATGPGKGRYGVIITTTFPGEAADAPAAAADSGAAQATDGGASPPEDLPPVRLYPGLYRDRSDYQGAIPLALDPWLVFRKTADPPLSLERVLSGGAGVLILPGAEPEAADAWAAQLLQASPGSFPPDRQAWEAAKQGLFHGNNRFQQGALTYTWYDGWIRLLQEEPAWLYAPLSRTRGLAAYDAGRLDAAVFPIPGDWNTYGLQAELVWAVPVAPEGQEASLEEASLEEAKAWLATAETQGTLAELLGWIPAQSGGVPYDTLAREAQVAWFSSGYIWQTPAPPP